MEDCLIQFGTLFERIAVKLFKRLGSKKQSCYVYNLIFEGRTLKPKFSKEEGDDDDAE